MTSEHEPLHIKYRPAKFDDVVGQDAAVKSLRQLVGEAKTHAFLLTGSSGLGKTTLARIAANELGCNIEEIDAATYTGIDDMRQVVESLRYKPFGAERKALIIDEAHGLSRQSWESLLKALEEPPAHAYWFLCTTEPGKVKDTIRTRCAVYDLAPVPEDDIFDLIADVAEKEEIDTSDDVLDLVAAQAGGSPRQALVYLAQCRGVTDRKTAAELLKSAQDSKEVIDLCRWLASGQGQTWAKAVKHLEPLKDQNAESVRLTVVNYFTAVLLGTTKESKAKQCLAVLDAFSEPCQQGEKIAPIARAVGELLFAE